MFFPTQGHHVLVSYIVTDLHTDIYPVFYASLSLQGSRGLLDCWFLLYIYFSLFLSFKVIAKLYFFLL